jgi:hypothetical protein
VAAQALNGCRVMLALSTIDRASERARVVLFRVVSRAANRARPIWNSILMMCDNHKARSPFTFKINVDEC